jgi:hypothetical protein
MYQWLVFLHILAALTFFMAHGASAAMAFRVRQERQLDRVRALLDLSTAAQPIAFIALVVLLLVGIGAGIMGGWFRMGWIWAALGLVVLMGFWMTYYASRYYVPLRKALGMPYRGDPAQPPASEAEIHRIRESANPVVFAAISFAVVTVILWLMMFKPF